MLSRPSGSVTGKIGSRSFFKNTNFRSRRSAFLLTIVTLTVLTASASANNVQPSAIDRFGSFVARFFSGTDEKPSDGLAASAVDFESPLFSPGTVHNQNGWSSLGAAGSGCAVYDHAIVDNSIFLPAPPPTFGSRSLRMSNSVTSGCFGDQTFTSSLSDEAGETSAANGGMSGGTRQNRFSAQWQFTSADASGEQAGLSVVASPDRGDGARMSWIQMADSPTGLQVNFYDFQRSAPGNCGDGLDFVLTNVASGLARNAVHTIRVEMDFYDGSENDIVRVYVNGVLKHIGTSWEDYFRDCESNPTRTVDSILFRTSGTSAPATSGKGFLIDNLQLGDALGSTTNVTVTDANPQGWGFLQETATGSGAFVTGPATAPLGTGSARLTVNATGGEMIGKLDYAGTPLNQLTQLSYSSYQVSTNSAAAPALQLVYDYDLTDGVTGYQGRLVYEPYQSGLTVLQSTWQNWSPLNGKWWASPNATSTVDNVCGQATPCTWNQILALYPNIGIHGNPAFGSVLFKIGGGLGAVANTNVDNFTLGINGANTVFNFEPSSIVVDDDGQASSGSCDDTDVAATTLAAAVAAAAPGDTIKVCPGTYAPAAQVTINKAGLTIIGATPTKPVLQTSGTNYMLYVTAPNVTLDNLEIHKIDLASPHNIVGIQASNFTAQNNLIHGNDPGSSWSVNGLVSRAFEMGGGQTGLLLQNNTISHLRQPGYMNASSGSIVNNNVSGTRGWVIDGATAIYTMTGNTWGEPQNQGCDIALIPSVNPANYPTRLAMSMANDNAFICAQYAGGENGRAVAYVDSTPTLGNGSDNDNYTTIQEGVNGALTGGTVQVAAGAYNEDVTVNKTLKVLGAGPGVSTVTGPIGGAGSTFTIAASNVELSGFTITRAGNNVGSWNDPNLNTAGIAIQGMALTAGLIHDNLITGMRTAVDVNNSNGHTFRNNVINDNRTGFIFRNQTDNMTVVENDITNNWTVGVLFLDASGGTNSPVQTALNSTFSNNRISGNWYGQIVERQSGGSLPAPGTTNLKNFSGNWLGTVNPVVTTANSAEPGYAAQIPVAYGGSATAPGGQPDIAGPASANFDFSPFLSGGVDTNVESTPTRGTYGFQGSYSALHVSAASAQTSVGLSSIQEGINAISAGGNLTVLAGTYPGNVDVNKALDLKGAFTVGGTLTASVAGASVSPGNSPGIINSGSLSLTSGSTVNIELNGTTVGTQYDQLSVAGTVSLANATLNVTAGFTPTVGNQFVIVNNDGVDAVSGTFNSMPEGSVFYIGAVPIRISYVGGDGNDVVLSAVNLCNTVSIPTGITTPTGVGVTVPINVDDMTGNGLLSYDFTVTFDNTVINTPVVSTTGTLSSAMTITTNQTANSITVSGFQANPLAGGGVLLNINFQAVGAPGTSTAVNFSSFVFNEGACSNTTNGSVNIIGGTVSGVVSYANTIPASFRPVPNTMLNAAGSVNFSTSSAFITGAYTLSGFGAGAYTVTPTKTGDVNGISSFDAGLIAQQVVGQTNPGLVPFNANQIAAADVSGSNTITSFDAALIARWIALLPGSGSTATWKFNPVNRPYSGGVTTTITGEDYTATLMGEVSGNWVAPTSFAPFMEPITKHPSDDALKVSIGTIVANEGETVDVPVMVRDTTGKGIIAYQFDVAYDPKLVEPTAEGASVAGTLSENLAVTTNVIEEGKLRVVVYGAYAIAGEGTLMNLRFTATGPAGTASKLIFEGFEFNEDRVESVTENGQLMIAQLNDSGTISGRLLTAIGSPIANGRVTLVGANGETRTARSNSFGQFSVGGLQVGGTYTLTAAAKGLSFGQRTVSITANAVALDLIADE